METPAVNRLLSPYTVYSDSTLERMKKTDLIELIRTLETNWAGEKEVNEVQYYNCANMNCVKHVDQLIDLATSGCEGCPVRSSCMPTSSCAETLKEWAVRVEPPYIEEHDGGSR